MVSVLGMLARVANVLNAHIKIEFVPVKTTRHCRKGSNRTAPLRTARA